MKIEGIVKAVSEKNKGICVNETWYNFTEKTAEFMPRKGQKVELTVDEKRKVLFCKTLPESSTTSKTTSEKSQQAPSIVVKLPTEEELINKAEALSEKIWSGNGAIDLETKVNVRLEVWKQLMLDRRTRLIQSLRKELN